MSVQIRIKSLFKTVLSKNLIGIQSVKHSLDRDQAGHYVGLELGLDKENKSTFSINSPRNTVNVLKFRTH